MVVAAVEAVPPRLAAGSPRVQANNRMRAWRRAEGCQLSIFEEQDPPMSRLKQRKAQLIEKIESIQDEHLLDAVEKTLAGGSHYSLSLEQQEQLQESLGRYLRGETKTYSLEEAITKARKAAHG